MKLYMILIFFSIFSIFESYKISGNKLTISSPGAFPIFISTMLFIFSIWIYLEKLYTIKKNDSHNKENKIFNKDLVFFIILLIIYGIILKWMGFIISTVLFLWASISFLSREKILMNLGISILTVSIIMVIFSTIFNVTLP